MSTQIERLYSRHYDRMLLTARTLLDNEEDARDVVSDVFTELLASGKELDELRAESYLLVSLRNRCMNLLEHRQIVEASEKQLVRDDEVSNYEEPPLEQVLDYMDTCLTDKTSRVMKQRFLGHKKYNEIANDMGISRIAVYKHLSHGLRQLRAHFSWYTAVLALLLLLSGVALAFFISHQGISPSPQQSEEPPVSAPANVTHPQPQAVHYEDATLEQILTDITNYHKLQLHFLSDDARYLRLHYDWHQGDPIANIVATLNLFESINLELRQNSIYVK